MRTIFEKNYDITNAYLNHDTSGTFLAMVQVVHSYQAPTKWIKSDFSAAKTRKQFISVC